jgi:hypothetical protein
MPVTGTNIFLDSDAAIDAWIEERRKRWPSAQRVEEKQVRRQEALNRGEIVMEELRARPRQRDPHKDKLPPRPPPKEKVAVPQVKPESRPSDENENDSDASSDGAPEEISSTMSTTPMQNEILPPTATPVRHLRSRFPSPPQLLQRDRKPAPRPIPLTKQDTHAKNLLLRNVCMMTLQDFKAFTHCQLLLPEIRHTVSTISQSIHFMVENAFFEGVELTPGEAERQAIQVIPMSVDASE